MPHAEIAACLGLTEATVAKRLERGKLALRRVLITDLRQDAAAYGLHPTSAEDWQETRIWCPNCGQRRLMGRFSREEGTDEFMLRCPDCCREPDHYFANTTLAAPPTAALLGSVKGYKPALSRWMGWVDDYLQPGLTSGTLPCMVCGESTTVQRCLSAQAPPSMLNLPGIHLYCGACGSRFHQGLGGVVLYLPEGRRFWREHQRIRALPAREVEVGGQAAIVRGLESVGGTSRLDVIIARDTFEVLEIYGTPACFRHP